MEEAEVAYAFESGDSYFQPGSSRICFVFVKWERTDAPPSDVGGVGGREGGMPLHRIFCHLYSAAAKFYIIAYGHGLESYICVTWCTAGELALDEKVGRVTRSLGESRESGRDRGCGLESNKGPFNKDVRTEGEGEWPKGRQ